MAGPFGSINNVEVSGNLGQEPEFGVSASGTPYARVSIAVSGWDYSKKVEKTSWIRGTAFNKVAEWIEKYCIKGTNIYVKGTIDENKWNDKEGNPRSSIQIIIDEIKILDRANKTGASVVERSSSPQPDHQQVAAKMANADAYLAALRKLGISPEQLAAAATENKDDFHLDDLP